MTQNLLPLADMFVKSALVLAFAWIVTRSLRRRPASVRHLVWLAACCTLLALPLASVFVPATDIAVFRSSTAPKAASIPVHPQIVATVPEERQDWVTVRAPDSTAGTSLAPSRRPETGSIETNSSALIAPVRTASSIDWKRVGSFAIPAWILGIGLLAIQWICSLFALRRIQTRAVCSDTVDQQALSGRLGIRRKWNLKRSADDRPFAAMTWGVIKPVVLLPQNSRSWSQERLEAVLLHELAHVRRLDSLSQLVSTAASALYWFNPGVWLCARAMRAEAETAADDAVIQLGIRPSDYANELLRIAADLGRKRQPFAGIGVSVMKRSKIEMRVKAILDPSARRRRGVTCVEAIAAVVAAALVVIPLASLRAATSPPPTVPNEPGLDLIAVIRPSLARTNAAVSFKQRHAADRKARLAARRTLRRADLLASSLESRDEPAPAQEQHSTTNPSKSWPGWKAHTDKQSPGPVKDESLQAGVIEIDPMDPATWSKLDPASRASFGKLRADVLQGIGELQADAQQRPASGDEGSRLRDSISKLIEEAQKQERPMTDVERDKPLADVRAIVEQATAMRLLLLKQKDELRMALEQQRAAMMGARDQMLSQSKRLREMLKSQQDGIRDKQLAQSNQMREQVRKMLEDNKAQFRRQMGQVRQQMELARRQMEDARRQMLEHREGTSGPRPTEDDHNLKRVEAQAQLELARQELARAKEKLERMNTMHDEGVITSEVLDEARAALDKAQASFLIAQARLNSIQRR